jgi:hypothetical protein
LAPAVRTKVDERLLAGDSVREIADDVGASKSGVARHKGHIPATLAQASAAAEVARADTSLDKLSAIEADLRKAMADAKRAKDPRTVIACARELIRLTELLAKIRGELNDKAAVQFNFVNDSAWLTVVRQLLAVLERFPEAHAAVLEALGGHAPPRELAQ